jgi:hypothetical protein
MNCISCGGKTETLDTRHNKNENTLRRRRQCKVCGHRFATIEQVAPEREAAPATVKEAKIPAPAKPKTLPAPRKTAWRGDEDGLVAEVWGSTPSRLTSLSDLDYL